MDPLSPPKGGGSLWPLPIRRSERGNSCSGKPSNLIMDPQAYYAGQSRITDPGEYGGLYDDVPEDIPGLCRIVQGLIIHYLDGESLFGYAVPEERWWEIDTCSVDKMLARIYELDERPLTESRPPERRLAGCCRDFATLFCSMARHQGVPARMRVGFGSYFDPGFNYDHWIAECWDSGEGQWRLVDPEMSDVHSEAYKISFQTHDVPRDRFIVGGLAWQRCRAGEADASRFGLDPDSEIKGWWFIQQRLIQDLAAQNKMELLPWHAWGLMEKDPGEEELALLDEVAVLTQARDEAFSQLRALYEREPDLKVPSVVNTYSPAAGPGKVALRI